MALYYYKAASYDGEIHEGEMEVPDEETLIRRLQEAGQVPIRMAPTASRRGGFSLWPSRRGVSQHDVLAFTQELGTLLRAGLPLDRSLNLLVDINEGNRLAPLASRVLDLVRGGASLSDALEAQGGVFSRFYVYMVRAGEMGGALDTVLVRLAEYLERARELRNSVISALIYPAVLVAVAVISVLVLLIFVVPQFTQLFEDAGEALPLPTQIVVGAGDLLRGYWWAMLLVGVGVVSYLRRQFHDPVRRLPWDRRMLRLPLFGDLIAKVEVARFSRTLGTLLGNGVPLLSALGIVKEIMTNRVLSDGVGVAAEQLKQGQGMAEPLLLTGVFPRLGVQMIRVGEETGRLEEMLLRVADTYDREVKVAVQRLLSLLEPLLIVGLGVLIAGIIMSILVAILSVNELAF